MVKRNTNSTNVTLILCMLTAAVAGLTRPAPAMRLTDPNQGGFVQMAGPQAEKDGQTDPAAILAEARILYVCSRTGFVKSEVIESELLKRAEFKQAGLVITKNPKAADLVMEVRRSNFTTEYPYVVIDQRTQLVVASGKVNSLFGTAAGKIASGFMKQIKKARTQAGAKSN
jgi:hypothetical protein